MASAVIPTEVCSCKAESRGVFDIVDTLGTAFHAVAHVASVVKATTSPTVAVPPILFPPYFPSIAIFEDLAPITENQEKDSTEGCLESGRIEILEQFSLDERDICIAAMQADGELFFRDVGARSSDDSSCGSSLDQLATVMQSNQQANAAKFDTLNKRMDNITIAVEENRATTAMLINRQSTILAALARIESAASSSAASGPSAAPLLVAEIPAGASLGPAAVSEAKCSVWV